jgi:ankyrin repeat protein
MDSSKFPIDNYRCPITQLIIKEPVIAEDGHVYEKSVIEKWFKKSNKSPMTNQPIDTNLIFIYSVKNTIEWFITTYPEYKKEQFIIIEKFSQLKFFQFINLNQLDKLFDYLTVCERTSLKITLNQKLIDIMKNDLIVKLLIDNHFDILNNFSIRLVHLVCQYSNPLLIKYIIDGGCDLECEDSYGRKPIHYICIFSTSEIIQYICDKNVDLSHPDHDGCRPIHYICRFGTPGMIKYFCDKNIDLEAENGSGWRPIHFLCKFSTPEMIKYLCEKNVNLECEDNAGWRPIHLISKFVPGMIQYICGKQVDINAQTKNHIRPIHFLCQFATISQIQYLIIAGCDLDCEDDWGWKPIHWISWKCDPSMIIWIITSVNPRDKTSQIKIFNGSSSNFNCIDLINTRTDLSSEIKSQLVQLFN